MKAHYRFAAMGGLLLLAFLLACSTAQAADKAASKATAGNVADRWVVWVKPGHEKEFEAGVKEHVAWRKSAGEPFAWVAYQPIVGTDLTYYVFRSGDHQWKDLDVDDAWSIKSKADDMYEKQIAPYTMKVAHFFEETDAEHSNMIGDLKDYKYFQVITRHLKSGSRGEAMAAIAKIHKALTEQKWAHPYRLAWLVGGKDGLRIILPMKSYADMAAPNPSVYDVLAKALGADDAAATLKQFGSAFEFADDTVYAVRPDLSTPK